MFLTFVRGVCVAQIDRVALGENPRSSSAFDRKPLRELVDHHNYTTVTGDQCQYQLRGEEGFHKKATSFLVPKDSSLAWTMPRRCEGVSELHPHQHIEGKEASANAGVWTWDLSKAILLGAVWGKVRVSAPRLRRFLERYREQHPSKTVELSNEDSLLVCKLLIL